MKWFYFVIMLALGACSHPEPQRPDRSAATERVPSTDSTSTPGDSIPTVPDDPDAPMPPYPVTPDVQNFYSELYEYPSTYKITYTIFNPKECGMTDAVILYGTDEDNLIAAETTFNPETKIISAKPVIESVPENYYVRCRIIMGSRVFETPLKSLTSDY